MFELGGLGKDNCFLGAKEEGSGINNKITSTAAGKFTVDVHQVAKVFGLLVLWRISSLLCWVHHFRYISCNIDKIIYFFVEDLFIYFIHNSKKRILSNTQRKSKIKINVFET